MASNKHPKARVGKNTPPRNDLKDNPGIGMSKGSRAAGVDPEEFEGDNTFEGDVWNDTTPQGGVNERQTGRTNK